MAEYINKEELIEDWNDMSQFYTNFHDFIENQKPSDVVERSKIDKAIEEINTEMSWGSAKFMQETMYHKGLQKALEILKRNIGE